MKNNALQAHSISATGALREAVLALQHARIETASLDARLLLQHVLCVSREELLADTTLSLNANQYAQYRELIEKRSNRRPVSQLIESREFWGLNFKVTGDTLDPRPDSETLVETVLARADRKAALRVLDLGTGTGCLLLSVLKELEHAHGVGVDLSEEALQVAKENAAALQLQSRATFIQSRWDENIEGIFDIIIANPPYIPTDVIPTLHPEVSEFEPMLALDGGTDGMECYRAILPRLPKLLAKNGFAAFEIGMGQAKAFEEIATAHKLQVTHVKEDLAGLPRCIVVQHSLSQ